MKEPSENPHHRFISAARCHCKTAVRSLAVTVTRPASQTRLWLTLVTVSVVLTPRTWLHPLVYSYLTHFRRFATLAHKAPSQNRLTVDPCFTGLWRAFAPACGFLTLNAVKKKTASENNDTTYDVLEVVRSIRVEKHDFFSPLCCPL